MKAHYIRVRWLETFSTVLHNNLLSCEYTQKACCQQRLIFFSQNGNLINKSTTKENSIAADIT